MKRILAALAALLMGISLCAFVGCSVTNANGKGDDETPPAVEDRVYNNVADFSSQQGWNGWYYAYRDSMGNVYYMVFDLDTGRWNGRDYYCCIGIGEQHPGNNSETLIIWEAPKDGSVSVSGSVVRCPADWMGDGVFYYVTLNDSEESYLWSQLVEPLERNPYELTFTTEVKRGDRLMFCINGNASNAYDSTRSNITIEYDE